MTLSKGPQPHGEQIHLLCGQRLVPRTEELEYHLRTAIFEEHLEQDRCTVHEYRLDLVGVLANCSSFLHGGSDVSRRIIVGRGADTEDIFHCADSLDKVLLDYIVELESGRRFVERWSHIDQVRESGSRS